MAFDSLQLELHKFLIQGCLVICKPQFIYKHILVLYLSERASVNIKSDDKVFLLKTLYILNWQDYIIGEANVCSHKTREPSKAVGYPVLTVRMPQCSETANATPGFTGY